MNIIPQQKETELLLEELSSRVNLSPADQRILTGLKLQIQQQNISKEVERKKAAIGSKGEHPS